MEHAYGKEAERLEENNSRSVGTWVSPRKAYVKQKHSMLSGFEYDFES